jgi:hypothetical protein
VRRLVLVPALLLALFLAGPAPSAGAQLAPPLPPLDQTVDQVTQTTQGITQTVTQTVTQTTQGATGTVQGATGTVQGATGTTQGATGTATGAAEGAAGSATGGGDGGGGVVASALQPGAPSGNQEQAAPGSGKPGDSGPRGAGAARGPYGRPKGGSAQPPGGGPGGSVRPEEFGGGLVADPLTVVKTNDADHDGAYSNSETTSEPEADVSFRVSVTNQGAEEVSIIRISDFFPSSEGVSDREVCRSLGGASLAPGQSVACTFTLADYAPPRGESKVNTISVHMLAGDAGSSTLRTLLATDASTVETRGAAVLGLVLGNPGQLAGTGAAVGGLAVIVAQLAAAGLELRRRGRARSSRRPATIVRALSPASVVCMSSVAGAGRRYPL